MVTKLNTTQVLKILNNGKYLRADSAIVSGIVLDVDTNDGPDVHVLASSGELVYVPADQCTFHLAA